MRSTIRIASYIFIVLVVAAQTSGLVWLYDQNNQSDAEIKTLQGEITSLKAEKGNAVSEIIARDNPTELENIRAVETNPKPVDELFVSGWIPDWDIPGGFNTVKSAPGTFDGLSPVWFWVNEDGSLKETLYMNDPEVIQYSKDNGIELIPTITLFDADIMSSVLNDETAFNRHIDQIMNQVINNNYDGIDLDYESTYLKDKELFFDMMEELALKLADADKKFVFTVLPKWGDEVVYKTLPQTRMVQDYGRIAELVDEFRIMTYEYTGRTNKEYGPIAPMPWLEDTIKYAIYSGVPREKLMLGIHTYSYDYSERAKIPNFDYYPVQYALGDESLESARAYFNEDVEVVVDRYNATVTFDEFWGEAIAEYTRDGEKRFIVYPTNQSIQMRKDLAAEYGLKGVVYWRLGGEGSGLDY